MLVSVKSYNESEVKALDSVGTIELFNS